MAPVEGAVLVTDGSITVKVSLTSPLLREPGGKLTDKRFSLNDDESKVMKSFAISSYQFHNLCGIFQHMMFLYFLIIVYCSLEVIQQDYFIENS